MTKDFLEDFKAACEKEGWPYLIVVAPPHTNYAEVFFNFDNWKPNGSDTVADEIKDILTACEILPGEDNQNNET